MGRVDFHLNTREEDFPCTHADLLKNDYFESEWNSNIFLGSFSKLHFTSTKTQPWVPCSVQLFSPKRNAKFKTKKHQKQHQTNGSRAAIIKMTYICLNKYMFFSPGKAHFPLIASLPFLCFSSCRNEKAHLHHSPLSSRCQIKHSSFVFLFQESNQTLDSSVF